MADRLAWANTVRARFIIRCLDAGSLSRDHLMTEFICSRPTASAMIKRFQTEYPGCMLYDPSVKTYVPGEPFKRFRNQLLASSQGE